MVEPEEEEAALLLLLLSFSGFEILPFFPLLPWPFSPHPFESAIGPPDQVDGQKHGLLDKVSPLLRNPICTAASR